jgi:hypothetical protein
LPLHGLYERLNSAKEKARLPQAGFHYEPTHQQTNELPDKVDELRGETFKLPEKNDEARAFVYPNVVAKRSDRGGCEGGL